MKIAIALMTSALLAPSAFAVEYVTLNVAGENLSGFGPPERILAVAPTSLIQIEGQNGEGLVHLVFTKPDGTKILASSATGGATGPSTSSFSGGVTGISQVRLHVEDPESRGFVTLKITTADEINAVTPSSVLVLPENSTGNFDVIIETSEDLVNWAPFFSQTVNSATSTRFFRTRVTKTP